MTGRTRRGGPDERRGPGGVVARAAVGSLLAALFAQTGLVACGQEVGRDPGDSGGPERPEQTERPERAVQIGSPTRFLARAELEVDGKPTGLLAADVDGDGRTDLLAAVREPGSLHLWRGGADGPEVPATVMLLGPEGDWSLGPVAAGRAAPDAPLVVGLASQVGREVLLVSFDGLGLPEVLTRMPVGTTPRALACGDVGADGVRDLVVVSKEGKLQCLAVRADRTAGGAGGNGGVDWRLEPPIAIDVGASLPTCVLVLADGTVAVGFQATRTVELWDGAAIAGGTAREPLVQLPTGGIPRHLVEVDLDGDGDLELAAACGDALCRVWGYGAREEGRGAWRGDAPLDVETPGLLPLRLRAADLDADGAPELVSLLYGNLNVGVLADFGVSGPALALVPRADVGQTPVDVALDDLDGDGRVDLVIANRDARRVSWLRGTGHVARERALFWTAPQVPVGSDPIAIAALAGVRGALPGAVTLDAVDETLSVLANDDGRLALTARIPLGPGARRVACADLDRDGLEDAVVLFQGAERSWIEVLLRAQDGSLERAGTSFEVGAGARELAILESGGQVSLATTAADGGGIGIFAIRVSDGGGIALEAAAGEGRFGSPHALAVLDLDGQATVVGVRPGAVWRVGASLDAEALDVDREPAGLVLAAAAADLDGDGRRSDLVVLTREGPDTAPGVVVAYVEVAPGRWKASRELETGSAPSDLAVGDLDGDGRDDLVVPAQNSHDVNLWLTLPPEPDRPGTPGGPVPAFARQVDLGAHLGPLGVALADVDGNGRLDLLVVNTFSDDVSVIYDATAE